jgi:uncharacterized membrane protein
VVAVTLVVLMGVAAIAIDGGLLQHNRRIVQAAADASALTEIQPGCPSTFD